MKRSLLLFGAVVALCGSLGMIAYRTATVGTFNILRSSASDTLSALLVDLQFLLIAKTTFVIGVVISCIALLMRDHNERTSSSFRWFCAVAGALLVVGANFLIWSLLDVKEKFRIMSSAVSAPSVQSLQNMIHSGESKITTGYLLWLISSTFAILAVLVSSQSKTPLKACWRPAPKIAFSMIVVFIGYLALTCLFSISKDGKGLELIVTGKMLAKPEDLVRHLSSILNKSLLVFSGVYMLGVVQLWVSLCRTTYDSTASPSS